MNVCAFKAQQNAFNLTQNRPTISGKTFVMDYEGYTFVFYKKKINNIFSLKCNIYYAFTFQT